MINVTKLDGELRAAGVRILGCRSELLPGVVDPAGLVVFEDAQAEIDGRNAALAVIAAHDPKDVVAQRAKEYPTDRDILLAIWQRIMDADPKNSDALKPKIDQVNGKYPESINVTPDVGDFGG